ncbi:MAG: carboxymuconolactone decarboxylase family protein [Ignavibacteria bacterium]|nr:carboxymuconolactone decarboxylase family protein [Ignavibacteria bacterium]
MSKLPIQFEKFLKNYPTVAVAYENLGGAVHESGPLDEKTRVLIKLAISIGARMEGAVHAQVRKAIKLKIKKEEIKQVALLAITTIGFPSSMAAMSWIDDLLDKKKGK